MNYEQFIDSLQQPQPPDCSDVVRALWHDGKSDWETARTIVQDLDTKAGALIHAYLHRKEGDTANASYWYQRAGEKMPSLSLEQEWHELVKRFL